mmetsp:Transcript_1562/g.3176  ORF Transcript_1562/g.3176 Transcript_1562/m.3176 type:complete len:395 (+) Transcript_1562:168-1352(+)
MSRHYDKGWACHIKELKKFKDKFGHCNVRRTQKEYITLSYWIRRVRGLYKLRQAGKKTSLTDERIKELDDLGFGWEGWSANRSDTFQTRIKQMKDFQRIHGHCHLPAPYPENPTLKSWSNTIRQKYRQQRAGGKGTLTPEQIGELESLGFVWNYVHANMRDETWFQHMQTLRQFRDVNGHCQVPLDYPENPAFGRWVFELRHSLENNGEASSRLSEEKLVELNTVGFTSAGKDCTLQPRQEPVASSEFESPKRYQEEASVPAPSKPEPFSSLASLAEICRVVSEEEERSSSPQSVKPNKKPKRKSKQGYGHWTVAEHQAFLAGLKEFGRKWTKIANTIPTRTTSQVRSHAQKHFDKLKQEGPTDDVRHKDVHNSFVQIVTVESGRGNSNQPTAR